MYRKKGREVQKYRVRWDDGSVSQMLHDIFELVSVETEAGGVGEGPDTNGLELRQIVLV